MTFVDASVLCAILLREPEAEHFISQLEAASSPITSAVAVYETVAVVARTVRGDVVAARRDVAKFLIDVGITLVPIGLAEQEVALDAFDRYGKGRHPAELNMGDCFAYACARTRGARLLYKGDDFARTDIGAA